MATQFRDLSARDHVKLFGPYVSLVIVGLVLNVTYPERWWLADLAHGLGHGLFVAGAIGTLVELFSIRFLIQKVADNLAERLVGRGLPAELQAHIREIVNTDFVRDRYVKSYSFSPRRDGFVTIDISVEYEVRNYSDSVREFVPLWSEEVFYRPEIVSVDYHIPGGASHSLSGEALSECVKTDSKTQAKNLVLTELVKLEPFARNDKAVCSVRLRYRVTMRDEYSDVTNLVAATTSLILKLDQLPPDLEFRSAGDGLYHDEGSPLWRFERPFVAGQGVRAWWFHRRLSTSDDTERGRTP